MSKVLKYLIIVLITVIHIIPFYILINLAIKGSDDVSSKWLPASNFSLKNFIDVWQQAHLGRAIMNNVIITLISLVLVIVIGAIASFPLARHRTKWNGFIYNLCVSCLIIPALTILVPLYKLVVDMGGINTYWAVSLAQVTFALPMTIFLYTGFIGSIPRELDEAGVIDGCNQFEIFFRLIFPLLKPITATIIILIGVQVWNDYQFSLFFLQKRDFQTVPVVLSMFISQFSSKINWVAAGCLMGMLPITVVFLFLQKFFVKGMADGAIKG
ncbi:carbohydrate ABC transporter permease [Paenibacillus alba]|uniref:Carbohydrate ABC transporter permease n=1 Tax=Paenibacillus alba TaxID=1197127 RepID=A0ABU6G8C3_9BACL|nr:carbohydrate ABC transporter permease [Paenibacillus alba]MEC0230419.1 carbohydrate ABC transporter permease [Paenibacillus alba]